MRTQYKVIIGVAVAIVLIIVGIGIVGYLSTPTPTTVTTILPTVTITGVNLEIEYTGSTGGYFGPSSQSLGGTLSVTAGSTITETFTLTSNAILFTHSINQVTVGTPGFTLLSVSPSLPYSVGPGGSVTITVVIQTPNTNYVGTLNIVLLTS